jgi:hypothetical protein
MLHWNIEQPKLIGSFLELWMIIGESGTEVRLLASLKHGMGLRYAKAPGA